MDAGPEASAASAPSDEGRTENEPDARGTLVIVTVFLMALAGLWIIMYLTLLGR
jgi:hypothetical protein